MPALGTARSYYKGERIWDAAFLALFLFFTALRLVTLLYSPLNLSGDEAHYHEWSRYLDYGYYSKGPLVAWLIAASVKIFGVSEFAVRFPAALCFFAFTLFLYLWVRKLYGAKLALFASLIVQGTLAFAQTGYLMTTDAPAILAWLIALSAAYHALFEGRPRAWLLFGLAIGLGMWSKYTLAFLPAGVLLFIVISPAYRKALHERWFYLGGLTLLCLLLPIIYWNATHDWVNLAHNRAHVVSDRNGGVRLEYLPELLLGQLGLLGPVLAWAIAVVLWRGAREAPGRRDAFRFFSLTSVPLLIFVLLVSLTKRIYANWPLPIYIGGVLALISYLSESDSRLLRYRRSIKVGLAINVVLLFAAHGPLWGFTFGLPGTLLPTKKLAGWETLASTVSEVADLAHAQEHFLLTDRYMTASALSFYLPSKPYVYLANLDDRRMTQYDIWTRDEHWAELKGRDALVVLSKQENAAALVPLFRELSPASIPELEIIYGAKPIRRYYLYSGVFYDGSPTPQAHAR